MTEEAKCVTIFCMAVCVLVPLAALSDFLSYGGTTQVEKVAIPDVVGMDMVSGVRELNEAGFGVFQIEISGSGECEVISKVTPSLAECTSLETTSSS